MKNRTEFPCTIMRGGTSKGIFLMEKDLPEDPALRDRIILAVFGSPDIRQIDGLGGADSLTSKLAIIGPAKRSDYDIDYNFGAVGIDKPFVDYSANCGNISSAVGPFAVDKGLVKAVEPFTVVRIYNANTKKMIYSKVPVKEGKVVWEGDYAIDGCPGTAAKIELSFMDPGGATTGKLLPTGNIVDELKLDTGESYRVTIVDAGNPTAFVRAEELKLRGNELPAEFDQDMTTRAKLEAIRKKVGEMMGIRVSQSIPKISFIAPAQDFKTVTGKTVGKDSVSMLARVMAMGKMHKTFAITAGIPAAIGAVLPNSVVNQVVAGGKPVPADKEIVIGHPSGMMDVKVEMRTEKGQPHIVSCTVGRTARKIMEGTVFVPTTVYGTGR
ncbi:MAG: 3-methylitaconate isomerase [Syntrophaceae bacterium PtaU1.Bin231]|nr:MAG: 3-methylitaconate isomerase [Syntrophaceae bacterium PtaU1.Bin231]HOG18225.1 PrpF domain-containing protein [Syntrophales bacterium]